MSDNLSEAVITVNNQNHESNPKVSVIVPVYNVEKYLTQCLDSITNQTLKDIEIICINDGSTDNSLSVLEEYAQRDNRIQVFTQSNKGLGAARNVGMSLASGKYVYFIDSDDFINLDTLEIAYNECEEKSLDFTMFQLINYDDETEEYYTQEYYNMTGLAKEFGNKVFNYKDCGDLIFSIAVSACNKFFNREFLLKIDAKFPEGLSFEDNVVYYRSILSAERVSFIEKHLYNRRRRQGSITNSNENYYDIIEITDLVLDVFRDLDLFDEFEKKIFDFKILNIFVWYDRINPEYKERFYYKIKDNFKIFEWDSDLYKRYINKLSDRNRILLKSSMETDNQKEFDMLVKIGNLELNNSSLNNEIKELNNKNKSLNSEISSLKEMNLNLTEKNKSLNDDNVSLKKMNESILNSSSWKVTAVFRKIVRYIKRFKSK